MTSIDYFGVNDDHTIQIRIFSRLVLVPRLSDLISVMRSPNHRFLEICCFPPALCAGIAIQWVHVYRNIQEIVGAYIALELRVVLT